MALGYENNLNMNTTTSAGVQPLYQPVLNRHLLMVSKPTMVHAQFGQKVEIPKGKGKTIAWDKMSPLPKAKMPLTEGITPEGTAINISRVTTTPEQYGAYVSTTDQFEFFTPNPSPEVLRINEVLGDNAGETLDSLTADVLSTGTNVQYPNGKTERASLTTADVLTVAEIKKAVRTLKGNRAKKLKGNKYVAIIHTDIAHDLMNDPEWKYPHQYVDTKQIYDGEIGELYGVRFVETADAKVFYGNPIAGYNELSAAKVDGKNIYIAETITDEQAAELTAADTKRKILVNDFVYTVSSVTAGKNGEAYLTCSVEVDESVAADMKIYPGEGAANGKPVYSTLVLGDNAYGVTDPKGTLENITKPLGSAGSADPLNQRSTMGWKSYHAAKILVNEYMVRIETVSTRY
ncbi:MAG: N4-gp56 family major capsid protein [Clostridia bacterium]|nr:N4-gp56 family major capsid protein [Clostridia bacterium]